jgi:polyhydroxybutyrate depolymerase
MRMAIVVAVVLGGLGCSSSSNNAAGPDGGMPPPSPPAVTSCSGKSSQPLDSTWTLSVGGVDRTVQAHVPASYDPTKPLPLVLNFHGYSSSAFEQTFLTGFSQKADAESFIVLYPEGSGSPPGFDAGLCCGSAARDKVDDMGFTRAILAEATSRLCVDNKRVFVTGFSNGGFMSHRIACELADVVAAVAPVSGVLPVPADSCRPARPIPVLDFHGTADGTVAYDGNTQYGWPSAPDTFTGWAMRDQCRDATPAQTYHQDDVACATYSQCGGGAVVTLCTITGGGHAWPGSAVPLTGTTQNINATDTIWSFFAAHPLP